MNCKICDYEIMSEEKEEFHYKVVDRVLFKISEYCRTKFKKNIKYDDGDLYIGRFRIINDIQCNIADRSSLTIEKSEEELEWSITITPRQKYDVVLKSRNKRKDEIELASFKFISEKEIAYFIDELIMKNNIDLLE
ncbi:MAG: hypothetical protein ACRC28_00885 [Clostridium sp.]|uniref:hypothetical protein n=1 Tax=Clostridia TaxID=186801 RepID=UPI003F2F1CFA